MKYQNDRLELAVIFSVLLHCILICLFWLSSLFTNTALPSAGGSGGETESFEAVMVDTGQVAAQYGKIKTEEVKKTVEKSSLKEEVEDSSVQIALQKQQEEQRLREEQKQKEIQRQKILEEEKKQQAELKKQKEEATQKKLAEQARLKTEAEAKRLEALAKQADEERKIKQAEAKKVAEQKKLKAEQEVKVKAEREAKEKAEKEAKAKSEREAKEKAEKEAKAKAEREVKEKAEKEAKAKLEREAKAKAEKEAKAKEASRALSLLEGGDSQGGNRNAGAVGSGGTTGVGVGANVDGNAYGQRIKRLIQSRYRVDPSFAGKTCDVKIFLERDGIIKNYQVMKGDKIVCDAAISSIISVKKVPAAPSDAVYVQYRSITLEFSLKVK